MNLLFLDFDLKPIREYCEGLKNKPFCTEIKRLSLLKKENWYYFFLLLREDNDYAKYIHSSLKKYADRSLEEAVLFLIIAETNSDDEREASRKILTYLEKFKKEARPIAEKQIDKAIAYSGKSLKVKDFLPEKEEQKKE